MIDVNLLPGKRDNPLSAIEGPLRSIKPFMLGLAFLIHLVATPILKSHWDDMVGEKRTYYAELMKKLKKVKAKSKEFISVREQVREMQENENQLNQKFDVVKKIIKQKKNPMSMLLYLARNIPNDVWLNSVKIENDTIIIVGESKSYKSIGRFMESLNNSIFFGKKVEFKSADTITDNSTGKRTEVFTLESKIERYF